MSTRYYKYPLLTHYYIINPLLAIILSTSITYLADSSIAGHLFGSSISWTLPWHRRTGEDSSLVVFDVEGRFVSLLNKPGWWFQPLRKILVSWDYYSQYMENNVPNHQPETYHHVRTTREFQVPNKSRNSQLDPEMPKI